MTSPQPHHSGPARAWLDVPYSQKDQAKAHGARWDPTAKRWYDPRPPTPALQPWAPLPDVPDLLPGEDRGFGAGLFVDLVPRTCWFTNVRTCVSERDWERLRRMILRRAEHRCEACRAPEDRDRRLWLEAHERWAYDDFTGVQALRRLVCLCSACHLSTHFGYANVTGRTDEALDHLRAVTGMTHEQATQHIASAEQLWIERSRQAWSLDLTMLTDAGVTLRPPDSGPVRARTGRAKPSAGHDR